VCTSASANCRLWSPFHGYDPVRSANQSALPGGGAAGRAAAFGDSPTCRRTDPVVGRGRDDGCWPEQARAAARQGHRQQKAQKHKHKHKCKPQPHATTCAGTCGTVTNNCKQSVDCGPCTCDPPCPACQSCDARGQCQPCAVCCDDVCCDQANALCHATTSACCVPDSKAQTCSGQCGEMTNNCGRAVDCGSCSCNSPCPECQICHQVSGECIADPSQANDPCGESGQICQADGTCACSGGSCGDCRTCGGDGRCQACTGCCDSGQCVTSCGGCQICQDGQCVSCPGCCQGGACHIDEDAACGADGGSCLDCGAGRRCLHGQCVCDGTSCADGCCDAQGQCLRQADQSISACGATGATCSPCPGGTCQRASCVNGACGATLSPDNAPGAGCDSPNVCCQGVCCTDPMVCSAQGQCACPHVCNEVCSACCGDRDCPIPQNCENGRCAACHPTQQICTRNEQCCDFYGPFATLGLCGDVGFPEQKNCCRVPLAQCNFNSDCCTGVCHNSGPGTLGFCSCLTEGQTCNGDFNCSRTQCQGGVCKCNPPGTPCSASNDHCCNGCGTVAGQRVCA
jgi:hypothetical protein